MCTLALTLIITGTPASNVECQFAASVFAAIAPKINDNPSGSLTYNNASYGITVQYPTNWSSSPGEGNNNSGDSSTDIVTFSLKDTSSAATLDVSVEKVDSGENLNQYVSDSISDDKMDLNFTAGQQILNGVTLAGFPAYKLAYSYADGSENFKGLETGAIVGNKAYFIEYENSPSQFDSDLPTAQNMIDSFKLTNSHSYS